MQESGKCLGLVFSLRPACLQSRKTHQLHSRCPIHGFERAHIFTLLKHNTFFFCTLLAGAAVKKLLQHTVKQCRAVSTARVLTATYRQRIVVHCLREMKRAVSLPGMNSCTCKKSTTAQLSSPVQLFGVPS